MIEPECSKRRCKNFEGVARLGEGEKSQAVICRAFPKGIPRNIAYGSDLHLKPVKGDRGIQYQKQKEDS